jgi:hypothetical protein
MKLTDLSNIYRERQFDEIENNPTDYPQAIAFISNFSDDGVYDEKGTYLETLGIFGRLYLPYEGNCNFFFEYAMQKFDVFKGNELGKTYFIARQLREKIKKSKKYKTASDRIVLKNPDTINDFIVEAYRDFIMEPAARICCQQLGIKYCAPNVFGDRMEGRYWFFIPYIPYLSSYPINDRRLVLEFQENYQMHLEAYPGRYGSYKPKKHISDSYSRFKKELEELLENRKIKV